MLFEFFWLLFENNSKIGPPLVTPVEYKNYNNHAEYYEHLGIRML